MKKEAIIAKRNNKIISIDELNDDEYGLKCNCTCIACNKPLIAVRGEIRRSHFKHKANEEHCHYDANEAVNLYVWNLLEDQEILDQFNLSLEAFKFLKIKKKEEHIKETNTTNQKSITFKDIDKTNNTFKVIIDDIEYNIKMYFDNKEIEYINKKDYILLSLSDLLLNKQLDRDLFINTLLELLQKDNIRRHQEQKQIEQYQLQQKIKKEELKKRVRGIDDYERNNNKKTVKVSDVPYMEILEERYSQCPKCLEKQVHLVRIGDKKGRICVKCGHKVGRFFG